VRLRLKRNETGLAEIPNLKSKIQFAKLDFRLSTLDFLIPIALTLASLALYFRTLAPDVVDADGGELPFAAWNFSFVHPTGYPLYLILGGLFQHLLPIGSPAYRLNIFTAITAALAVAAVYLAANEVTRQRVAAIVAAASFALTRVFWFDGSAAETYTLNAFFVAALVFIALRWQAAPSAKTFVAFAFVYGLALTHHRTIILWVPAFAVFLLIVGVKSRFTFHVSRFLLPAILFLLPLLLYLYIPLRAPVSSYATLALAPGRDIVVYDNSPVGLVNYLLGRVFQSELRWDALSVARLASLPQLLVEQFTAIGVALGVVGIVAMLLRKEWAPFMLLATGFAVTVLFASLYHIGDIFHYYIPAYLAWAMWIGIGIAAVLNGIQSSGLEFRHRNFGFVFFLLAVFFPAFQLVTNLPYTDRSNETREREQWTQIFAASIPPNAILISNDRDEMMPMWYMQYVENTRRDLLGLFPIITPAPEYANVARLTDSVLDAGRAVYFIKPMPGIEIKYRVADAPPLVCVLGRAADAPPQFPADAMVADRVRVIGYDVARDANSLRVAVYWQPRAKLDRNYTAFIHLLDASGDKIAQGNDHQVGGDFYPSSMWGIGETLRDEQTIALPQNLVPGKYSIVVGMYTQPDAEMLGEPVEIGKLQITNDK
jgi:hypothetical protein